MSSKKDKKKKKLHGRAQTNLHRMSCQGKTSSAVTALPKINDYLIANTESQEQRSASFNAKFMPEVMILISLIWISVTPAHWWKPDIDAIEFGIAADGLMLMASCTLIDIFTRLQRAPPWWIAPFAVLGVLMINPDLVGFAIHGFQLGWLFITPFLWSAVERLRELWTLPTATTLEKIRRRTLTFDRLYVGFFIAVVGMLFGLIAYLAFDLELSSWLNPSVLWIICGFYAISCFNVWRVHQDAFAKRPRSMFPKWLDQGDSTYLAPL
jgi:hypothetical protein